MIAFITAFASMMTANTVHDLPPGSNSDQGGRRQADSTSPHVFVSAELVPPPVGDERVSFEALRLSSSLFPGNLPQYKSPDGSRTKEDSTQDVVSVIPPAVVWTPFAHVENVPTAPASAPPQRCGACGSFLAKGNGIEAFNRLEPGVFGWNCVFCGKQNELVVDRDGCGLDGLGTAEWISNQLNSDTVEYVSDGNISGDVSNPSRQKLSFQESFSGVACGRRGIVVLVDENVEMPESAEIFRAVKDIYSSCLADGTKFMLVLFGAAVSVAVVASPQVESARDSAVILDTLTPLQAEVMPISKKMMYFTGAENRPGNSTGKEAEDNDDFVLHLLQTVICGYSDDVNNDDTDRNSDEIVPNDVQENPPAAIPQSYRILASEKPRALNQAIEVALELIEGVVDAENTRFITFITGVPTLSGAEDGARSISQVFHTDAGSTLPVADSGDLVFDDDASVMSRASRATSIVSLQDDPFAALRPQTASEASISHPQRQEEDNSWLTYLTSGLGWWNQPPATRREQNASEGHAEDSQDRRASLADSERPRESIEIRERKEEKAAARSNSPQLEQVFEALGGRAGERRLGLFFICYGVEGGCDARALHAAASKSRGGIVYSAPHGFSSVDDLAKVAQHMALVSTSPALVSMRVSRPLRVAHVIGSASETAAPDTFSLAGADPGLGLVIVLEVDPVAASKPNFPVFAVLQLSTKSLTSSRVITLEVPFASERSQYLESIDTEIAAVVLGKLSLADAGGASANSYKLAGAVDSRVGRLLALSPPMVSIANLLFSLRRGPLIERHEGLDEALVLRALFHRADCKTSMLVMAPRVFTTSTNAAAMAENKPSAEIMTQSRTVSVVDAGISVFVWIGAESSAEAQESVVLSAQQLASVRGLTQLYVVPENNALEDAMLAYLAPEPEAGNDTIHHASMRNISEISFVRYVTMLRRKQIASARRP